VHFKWFPEGTIIKVCDTSNVVLQELTVSSTDESLNLASGTYRIYAFIPGYELESVVELPPVFDGVVSEVSYQGGTVKAKILRAPRLRRENA